MTDRRHGWIQTYTGKQFFPLDPAGSDLDIVDIAHALTNVCRFNGHCSRHYSVAEHSILVALHVAWDDEATDAPTVLAALLHDASEAYLCDIPRPLKLMPEMAPYREMEAQLEHAIAARFGLPYPMPDVVRRHDARALATEYRDLVPIHKTPWNLGVEPWEDMPTGYLRNPSDALAPLFDEPGRTRLFDISRTERLFLAMYRQLSGDTSVVVHDWNADDAARLLRNVPLPSLTP